jgi:hypothetical protein
MSNSDMDQMLEHPRRKENNQKAHTGDVDPELNPANIRISPNPLHGMALHNSP